MRTGYDTVNDYLNYGITSNTSDDLVFVGKVLTIV